MKGDKIYVQLIKQGKAFFGSDKTGKFNCKVIEASEEKKGEGIEFWALCYKSIDDLNKAKDNLDPDVFKFIGIKEKVFDWGTTMGGMYIDNDNKETFFVNLYDNNKPDPQQYDKLLIFTEADYREPKVNPLSNMNVDDDKDFGDDDKENRTKSRKPF